MARAFLLRSLAILLALLPGQAQSPGGLPPVRAWRPLEHGLPGVSYGAVLDGQGRLHVVNARGLRIFDGTGWELVPLPRGLQAWTLALGPQGQVVVGAYGWIGMLHVDAQGRRQWIDLGEALPAGERDFGQVHGLFPFGNTLVAATERAILRFDPAGHVLPLPAGLVLDRAFKVQDTLWVQSRDLRLWTLEHGQLVPQPGWAGMPRDLLTGLEPLGDGTFLLAFRDAPPCLFQPGRPDPLPPPPWIQDLQRRTATSPILAMARTQDGQWRFGTFGGGLLAYDARGTFQWAHTRATGLGDDTVTGLLEDPVGHTWATHARGISLVATGLDLRLHGEAQGLVGSAACLLAPREAREGLLVGTSHGLFEQDPTTGRFRALLPRTEQVFALARTPDGVLVGMDTGLHLLRQGRLQRLTRQATAELVPLDANGRRFLVATTWGLLQVALTPQGQWQPQGLQPMGDETLGLVRSSDGEVWGLSSRNTLYRLRIRDGHLESFRMIDATDGLQGTPLQLGVHEGRLWLVTTEGLASWQGDRLVPETALNQLVGDEVRRVEWLTTAPDGALLLGSPSPSAFLRQPDGGWKADPDRLSALAGAGTARALGHLADGTLALKHPEGLALLAARPRPFQPPYPTLLRSVTHLLGDPRELVHLQDPRLQLGTAPLRFAFAAPMATLAGQVQFRTRVEGWQADWGPWRSESHLDLTHLPAGRYALQVQARTPGGLLQPSVPFSFRVVAPWTQRWPVRLLPWAGLGLLVHLAWRWRMAAHRRRVARLELAMAAQAEELRDVSLRDPLTGVRNRRFLDLALRDSLQGFLLREAHHLATQRPEGPLVRAAAFLLADLDHLKAVNDAHGNPAGDSILQQFAARLAALVREGDAVVRLEDDAFLVVLKDTGEPYITVLAERIRTACSDSPFQLPDGSTLTRSCSLGCIMVPFAPQHPGAYSLDHHLQLAGLALARAKALGRNRWVRLVPGAADPTALPLGECLASHAAAQKADLVVQVLKD